MPQIPFSPPDISQADIDNVVSVLQSTWITTGALTKRLEKHIAGRSGTAKAVCLNSATAGLELCLRALGIGPGDEVVTTAYTFTASASVIAHVGAKIILIDTAPDSFEMDYAKLAAAITPRTKAVIPVDIGGRMCRYDEIMAIVEGAKKTFCPSSDLQALYGRPVVIADAAHSFGASYKGQASGAAADFSAFSFHAVKNLTTAEGGAVVWRDRAGLDNEWLYEQFMLYALHGQDKDALTKTQLGTWEYDIVIPGYKCNMSDVLAALGIGQMERYDAILARRREIIRRYDRALLPLGVKSLAHYDGLGESSGHLYMARVPGATVSTRNDMIIKMAEKGIVCNVHFKPLPMMTAYKNLGFDAADFPNACRQYENEISLPLHTRLSDDDVDYVIENFTDVLQTYGN